MTAILRYDPETGPTLEEILIYEEPLYEDDGPPPPPPGCGCLPVQLLAALLGIAFLIGVVRSCLP